MGFARVKCDDCKHEYILPFSCKRRHFCPSCHQKRVIEFGEHLHEEVLEDVPHRQWVFSIPKRLRPYFMYDRKLLAKLSRCAWNVLSEYLKASITVNDPIPGLVAGRTCCSPMQPGCVIVVQTFGEFTNFNPHLHIIATDGCFCTDGSFSNKSRGIRKKEELTTTENQSPCSANTVISIVKTDLARKKFRKNWARLIQKVYFMDPLLCSKCGGSMKIISFIEDDTTIKKILTHLDLWLPQTHDPPQKESSCNTSHKQHHRSFEWWETINHLSVNEYSDDSIVQRPFEDEYSQLNPCTWEC